MELLAYLRTVRRRWKLVALVALVGAVLGAGSWLIRGEDQSFYRSTHTLISTDNAVNLDRAATFVATGEVPQRVADRLGGSPAALAAQVKAVPKPNVGILELTAVGPDDARSTQVADAFAEELVVYLVELDQQGRTSQLEALSRRISSIEAEIATVEATLFGTTDPTEQSVLGTRRDALAQEYQTARAELEALQDAGPDTSVLQTLSTAEAVPISGPEFQTIFEADAVETPTRTADGETEDPFADLGGGGELGIMPRVLAGGLVGLFLGAALVIALDRLDSRLRTKEETEAAFGWPVLAEVPPLSAEQQHDHAVLSASSPRSRTAESYRMLRSALLYAANGQGSAPVEVAPSSVLGDEGSGSDLESSGTERSSVVDAPRLMETGPPLGASPPRPTGPDTPQPTDDPTPAEREPAEREPAEPGGPPNERRDGLVVLVTSPAPSEGKSTTVANLAAVLGESGLRVLVVNCDFRRPTLGMYLGVDDAIARVVPTKVPNVRLLAQVVDDPEAANPADVVATQRQVIREARRRFDVVLLDTAPLLSTNDAAEVLETADLVVLVSRAGQTRREAADRCAELLERRKAPVVGVAMIAVSESSAGSYYYYDRYYTPDESAAASEPVPDPRPVQVPAS